jgi:predicted metal-dependent peptidase
MDIHFDLNETQSNILERCPEWQDLMNVIEFKNSPAADPVGYSDKTVYYNSRKMRQFPQDAQAFLIAGQLMHIQLAHGRRGRGLDRRVWDDACTAVVNELLIADGFEPPARLKRRKDAWHLSAEEMYKILYEEAEEDDPEFAEKEQSDNEADKTDLVVQRKNDKTKQAGDLQGAQVRDIEDPGLARAVAGLADLLEPSLQLDYDWFPADRIRDGILIEQFKPYPVPHAEILLDTSASIDEDLLRAFVRGVKEILREDAVVRVGCFDTEFYGFQEIHSEKDISTLEIKGAGGTNFETAVKAFTGDAETKIVFTDGYADMPETRCDAIWLVYSDMPVDPPGGKVIYVKKPEEINKYEIDFLVT